MTLLSQAIAIRDANTVDENTATKVGTWMVDAVGEIDGSQESADEAIVLATVGLRTAITGDFYAKTLADFYFAVEDDGAEGKANASEIQQLVLNTSALSATGLSGDSANLVVGIANTTSGAVQKITGANLLAPALAAAAAADAIADQAILDAAQAQSTADEALAAANAIDTSTFVTLSGAQTISGVKTITGQPVFSTGGAPVSGSATNALLLNGSGGLVQRELGAQAFASAADFIQDQTATVQTADFAVTSGFFGTSITQGWSISNTGIIWNTAGAGNGLIEIQLNDLEFIFDSGKGIVYAAPAGAGTEVVALFKQPTTDRMVTRSLGTGAFATISDYLTTATAASTYATISGFKSFAAYLSVNQSISAGGGYETIVFDNETYDTGSNYNAATGVITIPSGELWRIDVTVDTNHTDVLLLRLYDVTGTTSVQQARLGLAGSTTTGTASFTTRVVGASTQFRIEIAQAGAGYNLLGGTAPALVYISAQRVNR